MARRDRKQELFRIARKRNYGKRQRDAFVYGTLRRTEWKSRKK